MHHDAAERHRAIPNVSARYRIDGEQLHLIVDVEREQPFVCFLAKRRNVRMHRVPPIRKVPGPEKVWKRVVVI